MKKKKGFIAALLILVLLIAVYVVLKKMNSEEQDAENKETETQTVYEIGVDDIEEVSIQSDGNRLRFIQKENQWFYAEDENFPLSDTVFLNKISYLTSVASKRKLENVENPEDYGLENPQVKAVIKGKNGKETALNFGDINDAISGCYMNINDDYKEIYIVDSAIMNNIQFSIQEVAEKEEIPDISGGTIQSVEIRKPEGTESIKADPGSKTEWTYEDLDGKTTAAESSKVYNYMSQFASLSWKDFVTDDISDLKEYGLDDPVEVLVRYQAEESADETVEAEAEEEEAVETESADEKITEMETPADAAAETELPADEESENVEIVEKQVVFYIGKQDAEGNYYAKTEDSKYVYTLSSSAVENIVNIEEEDLASSLVVDYSFADLDKVTFVRNGKTYTVSKKVTEVIKESEDVNVNEAVEKEETAENETVTETKYYINDKEIDMTTFFAFFNMVKEMEWQSRDENAVLQGSPEMIITFEKEGGMNATVEYYKYDENFYLVTKAEEAPMLVNKMRVKDMLQAFDEMIAEWEK